MKRALLLAVIVAAGCKDDEVPDARTFPPTPDAAPIDAPATPDAPAAPDAGP